MCASMIPIISFAKVSNWIVVVISLDRFLALWFPQTTRLRSVSTAKITVVVIVVVAFGDSLRYYWMRDVDVITGLNQIIAHFLRTKCLDACEENEWSLDIVTIGMNIVVQCFFRCYEASL